MKILNTFLVKGLGLALLVAVLNCAVVFRLLPPVLKGVAFPNSVLVMATWTEVEFCFFTAAIGILALFMVSKWLLDSTRRFSWRMLLPGVCLGLALVMFDLVIARSAEGMFQGQGQLNISSVVVGLNTDFWIVTAVGYTATLAILRLRNPPAPHSRQLNHSH